MTTHNGACLCGAVTFTVEGDIPRPDACHCDNCRKASGHIFVSADVPKAALAVEGVEALRWYQSGPKVHRGFCGTCGSQLFFNPIFRDWMGVAMGALEGPTGTRIGLHTFVSQKGDYYEIDDDAPQNER